jgi:hypothetical protein
LIAYARETFTVERGIVSDAVKDLQGGMPANRHNRTGGSIFSKQILLLVSLLLILTWVVWQNMEDIAGSFSSNVDWRPGSTAGKKISGEAGEAGIEVLVSEDVEATSNSQEMAQPEMFDVYLGGPASAAGLLFLGGSAESLENESGLRIVHFQVPPEFHLLFRKPFRIRIDSSDREDDQEFYVVVVRYEDAGAVLLDSKWKERPVTREFMLDHWSSSVSWLVSGEMETETLSIGSISPRVAEIQKTLNELGYQNEMNGRYGNSTMTAVRLFQQDTGLKPDGLAGPRTLTLLEMVKPDENKGALP